MGAQETYTQLQFDLPERFVQLSTGNAESPEAKGPLSDEERAELVALRGKVAILGAELMMYRRLPSRVGWGN